MAESDQERPEEEQRQPLVVGLGASAGGLEALEVFFSHMPPDSGVGFVVVTHLHPDRVSLMPELIARRSSMPVLTVEKPIRVEPNKIYVSGRSGPMEIKNGFLSLLDLPDGTPRQLPIDRFFRSLAADQKERAVGIVLSGTGTDGTLGLKEIKGASGMTMAQEEGSARYAGMPHSAIASLQVDYVLPPELMPKQLLAYARSAARRVLSTRPETSEDDGDAFARIFLLLRNRTGHDFSSYKNTTINRRIERRMNVHQVERLKDYVKLLQGNPGEIDRLFKELLIGVTSFFRDPEAFEVLGSLVLPDLVRGKSDGHMVRAWIAGCSTGEEAYSLAILLRENMERTNSQVPVQIFATDLDPEAIEYARVGQYPESIAADVSPQRLERNFQKEDGTYRIKKEIRELVVFATQNLIEDPPFTKLDLLSCRNVLIYLESKLQQRIIPLFHYALRPGGVLFLGSSEALGTLGHLFDAVDKKWKVFRRKEVAAGTYVAELPYSITESAPRSEAPETASFGRSTEIGLAQAAERALLQHLTPASVVMHERGEIVHIHGRTGLFLEPAPGPQTHSNIYNMAREGLQLDLAVAVRRAAAEGESIQRGVQVRSNGHAVLVDLHVKKLTQPESMRDLFLVGFERVAPAPDPEAVAQTSAPSDDDTSRHTGEVERELQHVKEVHQSTIEELETANEELKSTNEELQSTNEELQSANEELETSKEEMQSLNEELQTVNAELHGKVEELSRANDDMKNLLNSTDIATIFLDNELHIKRYTEQAKRVIRLIPSDTGRPIGDLVSSLRYTDLTADAQEVLRTLVFKEAEVQSEEGEWYLMRILPYRTTENMIDGLVVTFVDVSKVRGLQTQTEVLAKTLQQSSVALFAQDRQLRYTWVIGSLFGVEGSQAIGKTDAELLPARDAELLGKLKSETLEGRVVTRERVQVSTADGKRLYEVEVTAQHDSRGQAAVLSGVAREITADGVSRSQPT